MNSETMKAIVVTGEESIQIQELPRPKPDSGEILVRLETCLICTWEQRIFQNTGGVDLPFVPGHEAAGVVAEIPEDTSCSFRPGDAVVVKTLDSCGHCHYCYQGLDNQCIGKAKKRFYGGIPGSGGMAQYISLPVSRVYPLQGADKDFDKAAFAEPISCCLRSLDMANVQMGDDVVVVGGGIMGQLHAVLCKMRGARVIMVEPDAARRTLALEQGTHVAFSPLEKPAIEEVMNLTQNLGAQAVFLTAPVASLASEYVGALSKTGRLVCYSSFHPKGDVPFDPNHIHYSEKIITGAYSPTSKGFYVASRMISNNLIDVTPFISKMFSLEDAKEAFVLASSPATMRVGIRLWK